MIYLASPYSQTHYTEGTIQDRVRKTTLAAAALFKQGVYVFSPIVHGHQLTEHDKSICALDWNRWIDYDFHMIDISSGVVVLMLPGWKESVGVTDEIQYAESCGKRVVYMTPDPEW